MLRSEHSHLWPGVPLALASAVLFGASTPLPKVLLGSTLIVMPSIISTRMTDR